MTSTIINRMKGRAIAEVHSDPLTLVLLKMDENIFCMIEVFKHEVQNIDAAGLMFYKCIKTEIGEIYPNYIHKETINMNLIEIEDSVSVNDFILMYIEDDESIPCCFKK